MFRASLKWKPPNAQESFQSAYCRPWNPPADHEQVCSNQFRHVGSRGRSDFPRPIQPAWSLRDHKSHETAPLQLDSLVACMLQCHGFPANQHSPIQSLPWLHNVAQLMYGTDAIGLLEPSLACLSGILICLHQRCACARSQASKSMFCAHLSEKVPPSQPTVMECLACLAHAAPMSVVLASTSRWVKKMASCHLLGHFLGFQRRRMPGFGLGEIKGACSRPWTAWLPIWLTPTQAFYFQTVLMRFNDCLLDCAHLRSCPYLDRTTEADWSAVP